MSDKRTTTDIEVTVPLCDPAGHQRWWDPVAAKTLRATGMPAKQLAANRLGGRMPTNYLHHMELVVTVAEAEEIENGDVIVSAVRPGLEDQFAYRVVGRDAEAWQPERIYGLQGEEVGRRPDLP